MNKEIEPIKTKTKNSNKTKKDKKIKKIKTFSIKKIPSFYKKKKNIENIEKKIFKYLLLAEDKSFVQSLYIEKEGVYALIEDKGFTKKEITRLKKIFKEIKSQKAFRVNIIPLGIAVGFVFALFFCAVLTKDLVLKIIVEKTGAALFQAKCDVKSAHISLFDAHIRLERIQQANKNAVMTNLFEIDLIDLDFDLLQLLKKKFVSENIEVSGIAWGTQREKSGYIKPKEKKAKEEKEGEGFDLNTLLALPIIQDEKNDIIESLSHFNPETIISNLNNALGSPKLAHAILEDVEKSYSKYASLPSEWEKELDEAEKLFKEIQKIDIEDLKKNPAKLPDLIALAQSSLEKTKTITAKVDKTSKEIQTDSKKIIAYSKEINTAFSSDLDFIKSEIKNISSFSFDDAKSLFSKELEKIAIRSLGKYYPYAVLAFEKYQAFSTKPKKEVKPKKEKIIRTGRLITYKKDSYPNLLFKNIFVSSSQSSNNIQAQIQNISSDMNLWGHPTSAEFIVNSQAIKNYASFIFDLRDDRENLILLNYDGSGYKMDFDTISKSLSANDSTSSYTIPGIPHISGTSLINASLKANEINNFTLEGSFLLDPFFASADSFEPVFVHSLYEKALQKLNTFDAGFKIKNTKEDGFNISLRSDIDTQFMQIFSELMNEEISSIKEAITKEAEKYLKEQLAPVYEAIGEFDSIEDLVDGQKKKLEGYQKEIEKKLDEIKNAASARLEAEKQKALDEAQKEVDKAKEKALDAAEEAAKNVFKGLF